MDRKSWVVVVACVAFLIGWQFYIGHRYPARPPGSAASTAQTSAPAANARVETTFAARPSSSTSPQLALGQEKTEVLENEWIRVVFSSHGGGVRQVELKKHFAEPKSGRRVVLNEATEEPIFNLSGWEGGQNILPYELERRGDQIVARRRQSDGVAIERFYKLGTDYQVYLEQKVVNTTMRDIVLPGYRMHVGTAAPLHLHDSARYLAAGWKKSKTGSYEQAPLPGFAASSFLGMKMRQARAQIASEGEPLLWASVQNQFFTMILKSAQEWLPLAAEVNPVVLPNAGPKGSTVPEGVRSQALFGGFSIAPRAALSQNFELYAGPKEYARLKDLGRGEEAIMDFGIFGFVVVPLLSTLRFCIP